MALPPGFGWKFSTWMGLPIIVWSIPGPRLGSANPKTVLDTYSSSVTKRPQGNSRSLQTFPSAQNGPNRSMQITKDGGTAGDEGEENWATLLRGLLPAAYHVVTKGKIISQEGQLSPQVDVLVLKPSYPPKLHTMKTYFLAGVAAAFECKLTLRKHHLDEAVSMATQIKRLTRRGQGTPYLELVAGPIVGLVSHSHSWKPAGPTAVQRIDKHLNDADSTHVQHPREMLDLLCVADLATWSALKESLESDSPECSTPSPCTTYNCYFDETSATEPGARSVGYFVRDLLIKLAWNDPPLQEIASYFSHVTTTGSEFGYTRRWSSSVYSEEVRARMAAYLDHRLWDVWSSEII